MNLGETVGERGLGSLPLKFRSFGASDEVKGQGCSKERR